MRNAKDALDGTTPLDLARERLEKLEQPKAGADDKEYLDEKRKIDKIIEYLEKGMPAGA